MHCTASIAQLCICSELLPVVDFGGSIINSTVIDEPSVTINTTNHQHQLGNPERCPERRTTNCHSLITGLLRINVMRKSFMPKDSTEFMGVFCICSTTNRGHIPTPAFYNTDGTAMSLSAHTEDTATVVYDSNM